MTEMTAEQAAEWERSPSFRVVWETLQEVGQKLAEAGQKITEVGQKQAKTDEQLKETAQKQAEAAQRQAEAAEQLTRLEKTIERVSDNVGGVSRSIGKWVEQMVAANLWEKFDAFEYVFTKGAPNMKFRENGQTIAEVDVFLENGDYVMPVEAKVDLTIEDVNDHIDRIKKIRLYMDSHNDKRTIVGAVAGAIVPDNVRRYAQKKGLYVLEQSGDSVAVAEMPEGFVPQKW